MACTAIFLDLRDRRIGRQPLQYLGGGGWTHPLCGGQHMTAAADAAEIDQRDTGNPGQLVKPHPGSRIEAAWRGGNKDDAQHAGLFHGGFLLHPAGGGDQGYGKQQADQQAVSCHGLRDHKQVGHEGSNRVAGSGIENAKIIYQGGYSITP
jgi:hypothetical protein